jgi:hypothetical protein
MKLGERQDLLWSCGAALKERAALKGRVALKGRSFRHAKRKKTPHGERSRPRTCQPLGLIILKGFLLRIISREEKNEWKKKSS